ncbi:phage minor structural protein GP20 [Gluconobacter japonicus]|uniref:Phage minor structual protein GP20 n=2 Tax=Gluconobacter frateurii TaxID=38308 RepID=A0ABQ0Q8S4_9PROT|nr:phage minor structural protein GP20 [Gluconobacter japonicus]GBR09257.1 phage minor structual protein GP20 [Gluconobacter frateurii NRIC 0228]
MSREKMSGSEDTIEDVAELRQALAEAMDEVKSVRQAMAEAEVKREELQRTHEEVISRVKRESDHDVMVAALRSEAIRMGAHNPDDVVRLVNMEGVSRNDDGTVVGVTEVLERTRNDRAYLFGDLVRPGYSSGTTVGHPAPRPGEAEAFNARSATDSDYEARKWQFLAGA